MPKASFGKSPSLVGRDKLANVLTLFSENLLHGKVVTLGCHDICFNVATAAVAFILTLGLSPPQTYGGQ